MDSQNELVVVGRYDDFTGIGAQARSFIQVLENVVNLKFVNTRVYDSDLHTLSKTVEIINSENYHDAKCISVFTDVTSNGSDDVNYLKCPRSLLKVIVSIFDSTELPNEWVNIINENFHMVLVSSEHQIPIYKKSGVKKPIFVLPIMIDDYRNHKFTGIVNLDTDTNEYVFGCVAAYDERKNIDLLIKAFVREFSENDHVKLRVHLPYSNSGKRAALIEKCAEYKNVEITSGFVSKYEYANLLHSFDQLVLVSKAEGFSITPREAMLIGKKVLLSKNFAHSIICNEVDVDYVESVIPCPALYESIGSRLIGLQYDIFPSELRVALRKSYEVRNELDVSKEFRVKWAETFTKENLLARYRSFLGKNKIIFSEKNEINSDELMTSDVGIILKYEEILGKQIISDSLRNLYNVKKVIAIAGDAGFYSNFNKFLSYLVWSDTEIESGQLIIVPDWRACRVKEHYSIDQFESYCYSTDDSKNIWLDLFEQLPYEASCIELYENNSLMYSNSVIRDDFNSEKEPNLTYKHAYHLYKSPDFQQWRRKYNYFYKKYVKNKKHLQEKIDSFVTENFDNKFKIAVQVRHPSHVIEQHNSSLAGLNDYIAIIEKILVEKKLLNSDFVIFVASDQDSVIKFFTDKYGKNVTYMKNITRLSVADDKRFSLLDSTEKFQVGHQVQHIAAKNRDMRGVHMAEEVIIDANIVSACDVFIHVTSNVATAVSYMNPSLEMIYCE